MISFHGRQRVYDYPGTPMLPAEWDAQEEELSSPSERWPLSALLLVLALGFLLGLALVCWSLDIHLTGGPYDPSSFGTVGEWASGIGTAIAVVGAFVIFRRESAQNAEELSLTLKELQFQQQQSARHQAERVSAWLSCSNTSTLTNLALPNEAAEITDWNEMAAAKGWRRLPSTPPEWVHEELGSCTIEDWATTDTPYPVNWFIAAAIANASEQPVYDLRLIVYGETQQSAAEVWSYQQDVLAPTTSPIVVRVVPPFSDQSSGEHEVRQMLNDLTVTATFRDSGGRLWRRDKRGTLQPA